MNEALIAKLAQTSIQISDTDQLFNSTNSMPVLLVNNDQCNAVVSLQGAQLLQFSPQAQNNWLWLSPNNPYEPGQPIWGGIPLCFPWFGRHPNPDLPIHGFVQERLWELVKAEETPEQTILHFRFDNPESEALFPVAFTLEHIITLNDAIHCEIRFQHHAKEAMDFSWAWHSYFATPHTPHTCITGLEGLSYLDNNNELKTTALKDQLTFDQAVDAVFEGTTQAQILHARNRLAVTGEQCPTCIVWHPNQPQAEQIPETRSHHDEFICLERGSAFKDTLLLAPGIEHRSAMKIERASNHELH